ncbi:Protein IMPACT-B [Fragariocoptes setiger]|uniref:Protein IMPACT-B n=1 Tax=Fragariocoptes setiger TaxID=1670756 RepID=A0ABQ7S6X7_9ACAR|nr:Protein IMPACT-B [Fragariocoptes setiger]
MSCPSNGDNFVPEIYSGESVVDRKSVFQGHCANVYSVDHVKIMLNKLKENKKIANAFHNMYAYRVEKEVTFGSSNASKSTNAFNIVQDCDDDGEQAAGGRLLTLLQILNAVNVVVVVTRWYGGIQLGPARFKHINNAARDALVKGGFVHDDKPTIDQGNSNKPPRSSHTKSNAKGKKRNHEPLMRKLKYLTNDELKCILSDEGTDFIDDLIMSLPQVRDLDQSRKKLLEEVTSLSQINLAREPKFVRDRHNLTSEIESIKPLRKILEIKCKQVGDVVKSLEDSYTKLSKAAISTEEESESISNSFLEGQLNNDDFLQKYIEKRKLVHIRRAKADRLRASIPKLSEINFGQSTDDQSDSDDIKDSSV